MMIEAIYLLLTKSLKRVIKLKLWFYSLLLAGFIGLPWLLPYLDSKFQHSSFNITGRIYPVGVIALSLIMITLITHFVKKRAPSRLLLYTFLIGLLSIMPLYPIKVLEKHLLRGIHFYRYYPFLAILTPIALFSTLNQTTHKIFSYLETNTAITFTLTAITLIILLPLSPMSYRFHTSWENLPPNLTGKFIDTATETDLDIFVRTADHLVPTNTNLLGSIGLFFESAHTGLVYRATKYLINNKSFTIPIYTIYIEELADKIENPDLLLDWLGINYQAYTTQQREEEGAYNFAEVNISRGDFHHQRYYQLKKINDTPLVATLNHQVNIEPNLDLWDWWSNPERKLTVRAEHQPPQNIDLSQPEITQLEIKRDKISFVINSSQPAPVYLKFSHSPY